MVLDCKICGALVEASEVESYWDGDPNSEPSSKFILLRCPKCCRPFLVEEEPFEDKPTILYPPVPRVNPSLPTPIQGAFAEAEACFRAKAFTATAIMCRKTLEGIGTVHDVHAKGLLAALRELKERGIIENRLFEWADALRISGNEAAHDVTATVAAEDAHDLLEFSRALIEYIFTFRDRFEAFLKRRGNRKAPNPLMQPPGSAGG